MVDKNEHRIKFPKVSTYETDDELEIRIRQLRLALKRAVVESYDRRNITTLSEGTWNRFQDILHTNLQQ